MASYLFSERAFHLLEFIWPKLLRPKAYQAYAMRNTHLLLSFAQIYDLGLMAY